MAPETRAFFFFLWEKNNLVRQERFRTVLIGWVQVRHFNRIDTDSNRNLAIADL